MLLLFRLTEAYAAAGVLAAAAFLLLGIERAVPAARGSYAFRPLLLPGLILLWPLVLWRWRRLAADPQADPPAGRHYQATHRAAWLLLGIALPALLLLALALRQPLPIDAAPIRLAAPAGSGAP